jgi:hypothetical protein
VKTEKKKESSSAFFQKLRPKFLDWKPPTEEEKALEVKVRRDAREAELKRVTELAREREVESAIGSEPPETSNGNVLWVKGKCLTWPLANDRSWPGPRPD